MSIFKIRTPNPQSITSKGGVSGAITWASDFGALRTADFERAQRVLDSEVLRLDSPYLPFRDGYLEGSGILSTELGSGLVQYATPYARRLYYNPQYNFDTSAHSDAGGEWFERAKRDHLDDWLRTAKSTLGGT